MQDRFTKWVEIKPLRKASGRSITTAFIDLVVMRFGCLREVVSDNGRLFISHEFTDLLKEYGIIYRRTPAYTPQCNPVERANRVIKTLVAQFVQKTQNTWDQRLPKLRFAYNTATSESTGYTPAYLNMGRELIPPGSLVKKAGFKARASTEVRLKRLAEAVLLARTKLAILN